MLDVNVITGDMTLYQGDSGDLKITGIPTDRQYTAYFRFYNKARKKIGFEISTNVDGDKAVFFIPDELTNLLIVPNNQEEETYYYGVKFVWYDEDGNRHEDTQVIGNKQLGDLNEVTVYPKQCEGEE